MEESLVWTVDCPFVFRPAKTIVFQIDSEVRRMTQTINIRNVAHFQVLYKVKTTSPDGYRVKPIMGLLKPNEEVQSYVTLLPHNQYHLAQDKFLVMVAKAEPGMEPQNRQKIANAWKEIGKSVTMDDSNYMEHQSVSVSFSNNVVIIVRPSHLVFSKAYSGKPVCRLGF
jgi:hypothetical protein